MIRKRLVSAACLCLSVPALWPSEAFAQRHGYHHSHFSVVVGAGFYYNPFFYYSPFYWGGWGYPGWGFGPYPYPYYGGYWYGPSFSDARLLIKPVDAEVFVDGYYVGRVDNFDGIFQRLDLPPGEHEITVYREGYRTYRQKNLFRPGEGYKFQAALEPLGAGETQEPRPVVPPTSRDPQSRYGQPPGPPPYQPGPEGGRTMPLPEQRGERRGTEGFGTLAVRVQPADAIITIDGEKWDSPEGGSRLLVQLPAGRHRIDVRKDGFKPYSTSVEIRAGETETVNVSLSVSGGVQQAAEIRRLHVNAE